MEQTKKLNTINIHESVVFDDTLNNNSSPYVS